MRTSSCSPCTPERLNILDSVRRSPLLSPGAQSTADCPASSQRGISLSRSPSSACSSAQWAGVGLAPGSAPAPSGQLGAVGPRRLPSSLAHARAGSLEHARTTGTGRPRSVCAAPPRQSTRARARPAGRGLVARLASHIASPTPCILSAYTILDVSRSLPKIALAPPPRAAPVLRHATCGKGLRALRQKHSLIPTTPPLLVPRKRGAGRRQPGGASAARAPHPREGGKANESVCRLAASIHDGP